MRISYRFHTPLALVLPVLVAMATAIAVTRGGTALLALTGVAALAVVAIAVSLKPEHLLLLWLGVAPFLQDVGTGRLQHLVRIALYSAPPLLFLVWTLLQRRAVRGSFIDLLPAVWAGYVVGSALLAGVNVSATQVFSIVVTGAIVYYFCAFCSLEEGIEHRVVRVLLASIALVSVVVEVGKFAGHSYGYQADPNANVERAVGPLSSPAVLGTVIGAGLALALAVLVWAGPSSLRRLAFVSLLVGLPALFLTLTRGPLIAGGVVAVLIVLSRSRTRWPGVVAGIVAALVVAGLWASITSTGLYKNRFSNQTNVQERVIIDRWSLELAGRKPFLGWGYGSFDEVKNSANLSTGSSSITHADVIKYTSHNTYLTVLVELGGIGLLLLTVPWLVIARSSFRLTRIDPSSAWLVVGLLGVLGVWIINAGTFDMRFFALSWVLPWLAVGLLRRRSLTPLREGDPQNADLTSEGRRLREAFIQT
jgi:O-antigen ligase